ncbi:small ribosomal subunit protein mS22 [Anabrus simplex]|uniref:small ribosomal subunit protein mS22 n=1 Tax=Anabrus simplex TaxID=316456 RepID=UPI0035A2CF63
MPSFGFSLVMRRFFRSCSVHYAINLTKSQYFRGNVIVSRKLTGGDVRDPAPLFFNPEVQKLLRKLTKVDMKKVFKPKKDGQKLDSPEYKFMTTEELNKCIAEAEKRAEEKLQIPPIVKEREDINEELFCDPALKGYDQAKYVFTDITYGVSDKNRLVVVRDANGSLRKASWDERFRMNQIYFPRPGRQLRPPHMFEDDYLKRLLEKEEYEFILDRACVQFEPDDPKYHAVTSAVYMHIENGRKFEVLASTRHFGAFVFHLAWSKCIDNLLLHYIGEARLTDAVDLIRLYSILNPETRSDDVKYDDEQPIPLIQHYIEQHSAKKSALELALQTYHELARQRQELEDGIRRAHGHITG